MLSVSDRIFGKVGYDGKSECEGYSVAGASSQILHCPHCNSQMLWRDGLLSSSFGEPIQRWLCRDCGYRFSDPKDVKIAKKAFEAVETVDTKTLKTPVDIVISRQICVTETKNLDAEPIIVGVLRRKETGEFKQKLIDYALWLFENGRRETTITGRVKLLRRLVQRGANLYDPESVKKIISKQTWSDGQKTMQSTHTLHF